MKKYLFLFSLPILFLFSTLLLTACSRQNREEPQSVDEYSTQQYIGVLKPLGVKIDNKATHFLELSSGEVIYVYSNFYNLNSKKFLNKRVETRGILIPGNEGEKNTLEIDTMYVLEEEEEEWILSTNEQYEVSFQYPPFLEELSAGNAQMFGAEKDVVTGMYNERIGSIVYDNQEKTSLQEWTTKNGYPAERIVPVRFGKDAAINGLKYVSEDGNKVYFFATHKDFIYEMNHVSESQNSLDKYRNIFYEIVDTFEFLVPEDNQAEEQSAEESVKEEVQATNDEQADEKKQDDTQSQQETPEETAIEGENTDLQKTESETNETGQESTKEKNAVVAYVSSHINELAPEKSSDEKGFLVSVFEFVQPNYVYVEYNDSSAARKALLQYTLDQDTELKIINAEIVGYFIPGEEKDWALKEGSNPVSDKSREVVHLDTSGTIAGSFSVEQGYRYFESAAYKFKAQYPSNWYYAGTSGVYRFSNKPIVSDTDQLVSLEIVGENLDAVAGEEIEVGKNKGKTGKLADSFVIYVERKRGGVFKIAAREEYQDLVFIMAKSIQEE